VEVQMTAISTSQVIILRLRGDSICPRLQGKDSWGRREEGHRTGGRVIKGVN
jgi:hypothetical protein